MRVNTKIFLVAGLMLVAALAAGCKAADTAGEDEYVYKKHWEKSQAEKAALEADLDRLGAEKIKAQAELMRLREDAKRAEQEREKHWAAELGDREKEIRRLESALADVLGGAAIRGNGVAVPLDADILFDSGKTAIKKEGKIALQKLHEKVKEVLVAGKFEIEYIRIDGHTDTDPIRFSREYKDNWMLGAGRANAVRAYLEELGGWADDKLYIASYAYSQPVNPADTKEAKSANRRVEVFIVPAPPSQEP